MGVLKGKRNRAKSGRDLKQEFRDLLETSGWSQAEAARQLAMTPSGLSQIVRKNCAVRPSLVTLRLFGLLLWREKSGAASSVKPTASARRAVPWEQDLIRSLRALPPKTRGPILETFTVLLEAARNKNAGDQLPRRVKKGRRK